MSQPETICVNGEEREFEPGRFPAFVADLIALLGLDAKMVVAEVNGDIVSRKDFGTHPLKAGDRVELVRFVGGG